MWPFESLTDGEVTSLQLTPSSTEMKLPLSIDVAEPPEERIQRMITENPVIIFSRSSCYMCHVIKKLFTALEVHPMVIELEEDEMAAALAAAQDSESGGEGSSSSGGAPPVVFIGGRLVGGFSNLVALHLSGNLVPKLVQAGALWG